MKAQRYWAGPYDGQRVDVADAVRSDGGLCLVIRRPLVTLPDEAGRHPVVPLGSHESYHWCTRHERYEWRGSRIGDTGGASGTWATA